MLINYNYSIAQIETVCRLILSTKHPPSPKDKLEKVICDADLGYFRDEGGLLFPCFPNMAFTKKGRLLKGKIHYLDSGVPVGERKVGKLVGLGQFGNFPF